MRMILRNSKNSILRTPFKTVLFALLIVAVTAFLYLGVNTWFSAARMLHDCDENYTTIAVLEYVGENYPDESVYDETMQQEVAAIDFDAIAALPQVTRYEATNCSLGLLENFSAHSALVPYQDNVVLVITDAYHIIGSDQYFVKVLRAPYCYRADVEGRSVYLNVNGLANELSEDAVYVIHGRIQSLSTTVVTVDLTTFYGAAAEKAGVDCSKIAAAYKLDSAEDYLTAAGGVYKDMGDYYRLMNNKVYVYRTANIAELEEFHQSWVRLKEGRLFTEEEYASEAKVCVITETIAKSCGVTVGDSLPLQTISNGDAPVADCYWGSDELSDAESYTVIGIVNYYEGLQYNFYIPGKAAGNAPFSLMYSLGQATLQNGTADAFVEAAMPLLPKRATISLYDQGYQQVADSLQVILNASVALTSISVIAAVLILICFAFLFVDKQRTAVETMRCFGMRKREVRLYLLFGAGLIALVSCTAGAWLGAHYAGSLLGDAYKLVSELQALDLRYSDGYMGLTKAFTPITESSALLAVLVAALTFLLALLLCVYFARRTIEGRVLQKRNHTQRLHPPKRSSAVGGGALRYTLLSMRRGGIRSLAVPTVSLAMLLFISTLLGTIASYQRAQEELSDTTVIKGSFVTLSGKYSNKLMLGMDHVQELIDMGYVENVAVSYTKNYIYLGKVMDADGTSYPVEDAPWPDNPYALERYWQVLENAPNIVVTNDPASAPEFRFSEFSCTYLDGYGAEIFQKTDWDELTCAVSANFLQANGLSLGDTIRVYVGYDYFTNSSYSYYGEGYQGPYAPFLNVDMKIVGSFYKQGGEEQIYCPLPENLLDLDGLSEGEEAITARYKNFGMSLRKVENIQTLPMQELMQVLLSNEYARSCSFTLKDTRELTAFKDALEEAGFSGPKQEIYIRLAVMLLDSEYESSMSDLAQRSTYMEILYPILLALSCAVGLIMAFLMTNARREEIAIMRGMGARRGRIFTTFFTEQCILLCIGAGLGAGVAALLGYGSLLSGADPWLFAASYALGSALSILSLEGKRAFKAISERE